MKNAAIAVIRWSARVLGTIIAGFLLYMAIGESQGKPLALGEVIGLALLGIFIVAMFLAFKWRRAGTLLGVAALGSFFVQYSFFGPGASVPKVS